MYTYKLHEPMSIRFWQNCIFLSTWCQVSSGCLFRSLSFLVLDCLSRNGLEFKVKFFVLYTLATGLQWHLLTSGCKRKDTERVESIDLLNKMQTIYVNIHCNSIHSGLHKKHFKKLSLCIHHAWVATRKCIHKEHKLTCTLFLTML